MTQQQLKPNYTQTVNINSIKDIPRASSSGDEKDGTSKSHRSPTTKSPKMEKKRNNPQSKGKEEATERMLNEIETSQLSDIKFKAMVIRKLNELTENYQTLQETTMNSLKIIST